RSVSGRSDSEHEPSPLWRYQHPGGRVERSYAGGSAECCQACLGALLPETIDLVETRFRQPRQLVRQGGPHLFGANPARVPSIGAGRARTWHRHAVHIHEATARPDQSGNVAVDPSDDERIAHIVNSERRDDRVEGSPYSRGPVRLAEVSLIEGNAVAEL